MQKKMQNISPIKQNILNYVDYLSISKRDFYAKTGISRGTLESNTGITEETMAKFIAMFPDVSIEWLITGKGEMLINPSDPKKNIPIALRSEEIGIPLIPIEAMAGFGTGESQILECDCEKYVVPIFKDAEFLIQVRGDSMYPKYSSGDVVACKKLPLKDIFFQWNKVYVLDTVQGALIKRIKKGSDSKHILAISENKDYEPFELSLDQVYSVAIVIGVIRLE